MHQLDSNMSKEEAAPPDGGGGLAAALETSLISTLRTPTNTGWNEMFANARSGEESEARTMSQNLKMRAAELRQRELQDRRIRQREEYAGKVLADWSLAVFDRTDQVHILAHANSMGAEPMDYLQQCEEVIRGAINLDVTDSMLEQMITELMDDLPQPRKTT